MQMPAWCMATVLTLGLAATVYAEPKPERIAFQLTGDACAAQHQRLISSLAAVEGIRSVDLTSVPEHVLVDIDARILSAHHLTAIVRQLLASAECLANPMESCISATALSRTADASHSTN